MDNKTLTGYLAKSLGREPKEISALIDGLATTIREQLCDMNTVALPGFGEFVPIKEDERIQQDLASGEQLLLPPSITVNFTPSSLLKRKIADLK